MPTLLVRTVKSSGGDYTSLSAAEAGEQGDLVSLDRQLDIACYAFQDTTPVTIDGSTTDVTRYIRVYTPTSERHDGKWNTSKYRIDSSTSFTRPLTVRDDHVRVEGIQARQGNSNANETILVDSTAVAASSDIRLDACIIIGNGLTNACNCSSGQTTVRNCIVYGGTNGLQCTFGANASTVNADNCTSTKNSGYGYNRSSGTLTLRNCYAGGNGTDAYNGTMTRTTCAHSSATVFSGSTASVAHSTANFVSVTSGSEDYHLVSGSALKDAGTDLTASFTTDIDGDTRSAPWDIGADEYVAAGGPFPWFLDQPHSGGFWDGGL